MPKFLSNIDCDMTLEIIEMDLIVNYELVRKIVSLGKGVKVLAPQNLINDVKKYLNDAISQY